jgi:hypothetical protein
MRGRGEEEGEGNRRSGEKGRGRTRKRIRERNITRMKVVLEYEFWNDGTYRVLSLGSSVCLRNPQNLSF